MSVFDLTGPQFLRFYAIIAAITITAVFVIRRAREGYGEEPPGRMTDPYRIAFLRGGKNELLRVTAVSLIDRGLIELRGDLLQATELAKKTRVRRAVEEKLIAFCLVPRTIEEIFSASNFDGEIATLQRELAQERYLPDLSLKALRVVLFLAAASVLLFYAGGKIFVALQRGRTNIQFLVVLSIAALIVTAKVAFPRRTTRGNALLANLRNLFRSLQARAGVIHPGGSTAEVALLAAVFGVATLPFDWTKKLFPKAQDSGWSGFSSTSCGSSCGSSCGGGCGGGCGGCGS